MTTPEGKLQAKITKFLEDKGFYVIKLIKTNRNGIPDLEVRTGNGYSFFVEVKTETGRTSKLQEYIIKKLRENGDTVLIPYGYEDFIIKYKEHEMKIHI